jgi:hypothetical protein
LVKNEAIKNTPEATENETIETAAAIVPFTSEDCDPEHDGATGDAHRHSYLDALAKIGELGFLADIF